MDKQALAQSEPTLSGKAQTRLKGAKVEKYKAIVEKSIKESIHARVHNKRRQLISSERPRQTVEAQNSLSMNGG